MGKYILPWFGGANAVWITCMLFFQVFLLGGYAYAHILSNETRFSRGVQAAIHTALLGFTLVAMVALMAVWKAPILPGQSFKPMAGESEVWDILKMLTASVGMPFLMLSTTGPLLQAWYVRTIPTQSPYRLYAISNLGSLLGLLSYPFVVEPALHLVTQARVWSLAYVVVALGVVYCAWAQVPSKNAVVLNEKRRKNAKIIPESGQPNWGTRLFWVAMALVPSVMLLATTNLITQDVANIPFLWMLPLAIYLVSFILCFQSELWYQRGILLPLFFISALAAVSLVVIWKREPFLLQISTHCLALFTVCMVCHGELVRRKPSPRRLTEFYFAISIGGVLGAIAVSIVAPLVFTWFWEYFIALGACAFLLFTLVIRDRTSQKQEADFKEILALELAAVLCLIMCILFFKQWQDLRSNALVRVRNFYGTVSVLAHVDVPVWEERNGVITHGIQFQDPVRRLQPFTYFGRNSGIGLLLSDHPMHGALRPEDRSMRVGLIGIGVGTLAAYAWPGDYYRFYEINPAVIELSHGPNEKFTYLDQCKATWEIVQGDARLSMERELADGRPQKFDLIVVDAFSSDAIPIHLLTVEAVEVYLAHLRGPESILAFHTTNKVLDLDPVLIAASQRFQMKILRVQNSKSYDIGAQSDWIFMARNPSTLQVLDHVGTTLNDPNPIKVWTDDYSNLLDVIKK